MKRSMDTKTGCWSVLLLLAAVAVVGCRREPCEDNLREGERIQVTILASANGSDPCQGVAPLPAGATFTFVAGPEVMQDAYYGDGERGVCTVHPTVAGAPPFLTDTLTSCNNDEQRSLGVTCEGVNASGCGVSVFALVNTYIPADADVIEPARFVMEWTSTCEVASCQQLYDARVERLDAPAGR